MKDARERGLNWLGFGMDCMACLSVAGAWFVFDWTRIRPHKAEGSSSLSRFPVMEPMPDGRWPMSLDELGWAWCLISSGFSVLAILPPFHPVLSQPEARTIGIPSTRIQAANGGYSSHSVCGQHLNSCSFSRSSRAKGNKIKSNGQQATSSGQRVTGNGQRPN